MTAPTVADTETGLPPRWRGPIMPTNTPAGDGRVLTLDEGAELSVRPLPLPLSAQEELGDGHDGSVVVGLMERVWLEDGTVWAEGSFDLGNPVAAEWARRLGAGTAGWVSADLSSDGGRLSIVEVFVDANGTELTEDAVMANPGAVAGQQRHITGWRMMGVTLCAGPAFETARIEPVWEGAAADPALVAAAVLPDPPEEETPAPAGEHDTDGMIALVPAPEDAARLAIGSEPAEELHVTLAYLADTTGTTAEQYVTALEDAMPAAPLDGKVGGFATFNPGAIGDPEAGDPAQVFIIDAPGLADVRAQVVAALTAADDLPDADTTHDGWIPHLTYAYGPEATATPDVLGQVRLDTLRVSIGGKHTDIPLAGTQAGLVAAGVVYKGDDFADPQLSEPTSVTVKDGRIWGHLACWGVCHTGFSDLCITAPHSEVDYHYFHQGQVATDQGMLPVGKITLGTGHASLDWNKRAALEHYDNSGTAVAVVRAGEDEYGIWIAGRILPGVSDEKLAELQRSPLSGDWRPMTVGGNYELIAALAVNVPGFPRPRALAASALVAAGALMPGRGHHPELDGLSARIDEILEEKLRGRLGPDRTALAAEAQRIRGRVKYGDRAAQIRSRMRAHRAADLRARVQSPVTLGAPSQLDEDLMEFWARGKGLARWRGSPHPYTALVAALKKAIKKPMPDDKLHGLAANIFHAATGQYPGQRERNED